MPLSVANKVQERYTLLNNLGVNGSKQTWLATDDVTGQKVIVKAIYYPMINHWHDLNLFERESQILISLDHPHIPKLLDTFHIEQPEGQYLCLVQEYIPGKSLNEIFESGKKLTEEEGMVLARELLEILNYLHSKNPAVIHRDIKPSNIIQGEDGNLFLIDFGAVQSQEPGRSLTIAGTFGFMGLEQFSGKAVPASDIYGLGVTLLVLTTGVRANELIKPDHSYEIAPTTPLTKWIYKALRQNPSDRYKDAQEALKGLEYATTTLSKTEATSISSNNFNMLDIVMVPISGIALIAITIVPIYFSFTFTNSIFPYLLEGNFNLLNIVLFIGISISMICTMVAAQRGEDKEKDKFLLMTILMMCSVFLIKVFE